MSTERQAGWYWARFSPKSDWQPSYFNGFEWYRTEILGWEIGERIPSPDEIARDRALLDADKARIALLEDALRHAAERFRRKITCPDDLCHGNDECIHGDPPTRCWTCNPKGDHEDFL